MLDACSLHRLTIAAPIIFVTLCCPLPRHASCEEANEEEASPDLKERGGGRGCGGGGGGGREQRIGPHRTLLDACSLPWPTIAAPIIFVSLCPPPRHAECVSYKDRDVAVRTRYDTHLPSRLTQLTAPPAVTMKHFRGSGHCAILLTWLLASTHPKVARVCPRWIRRSKRRMARLAAIVGWSVWCVLAAPCHLIGCCQCNGQIFGSCQVLEHVRVD